MDDLGVPLFLETPIQIDLISIGMFFPCLEVAYYFIFVHICTDHPSSVEKTVVCCVFTLRFEIIFVDMLILKALNPRNLQQDPLNGPLNLSI